MCDMGKYRRWMYLRGYLYTVLSFLVDCANLVDGLVCSCTGVSRIMRAHCNSLVCLVHRKDLSLTGLQEGGLMCLERKDCMRCYPGSFEHQHWKSS